MLCDGYVATVGAVNWEGGESLLCRIRPIMCSIDISAPRIFFVGGGGGNVPDAICNLCSDLKTIS